MYAVYMFSVLKSSAVIVEINVKVQCIYVCNDIIHTHIHVGNLTKGFDITIHVARDLDSKAKNIVESK